MMNLSLVLFLLVIVSIFAFELGSKMTINKQVDVNVAKLSPIQGEAIADLITSYDFSQFIDGFNEIMLIVGKDLMIQPISSHRRDELFAYPVQNKSFVEVLSALSDLSLEAIEELLSKVFSTTDPSERQRILSILPSEYVLKDSFFRVNYNYISEFDQLAVYISDQSATKVLVQESEDKLDEMSMVIEILRNQKDYFALKSDYAKFINEDLEKHFTFTEDLATIKSLIFHRLQLLKQKAQMLYMYNSIKDISKFEEVLEQMSIEQSFSHFKNRIEAVGVGKLFETDTRIIARYIDEDILNKRYVTVNSDVLKEIENLILDLDASEGKDKLYNRFNQIRFISVFDIISRFDKYAQELSKRLNKKINPLVYSGPGFLFDEDDYKEVINGFIEMVTNALVHGIEYPADRYRNGKPEHGNIKINLRVEHKNYFITIEDDGRGIDVNSIKESLYSTKRFAFDDIVLMSEEEVINCVFFDGISSLNEEFSTSTKGKGLYIIKENVNALGGEVSVESELNQYTRFEVLLPCTK
ncbi:ATP-binding protein [Fusibacter bizertensis]